jgi:hypothetical protein
MKTVEFRVRPVTRYILTRFEDEQTGKMGRTGSETAGEFDSEILASNAALAFGTAETHLAQPPDKVIIGRGPNDNHPLVWENGKWSDSPAADDPR